MAFSMEEFVIRDALGRAIEENVTALIKDHVTEVAKGGFQTIANAALKGSAGLTNQVKAFAVGYEKHFSNPSEFNDAYQRIAAKMRTAVRQSYSAQFTGGPGYYRIGGAGDKSRTTSGGFLSRYSGGSLKRAIYNPALVQVSGNRINFVDEGRLTREAAHWARMNFGAGIARQKRAYRIQLDGHVVGFPIGFEREARPGFMMPAGTWRDASGGIQRAGQNPNGTDRFFPYKSLPTRTVEQERFDRSGKSIGSRKVKKYVGQRRMRSRGIKGREFLDAGLRAYQRELPNEINRMLAEWRQDAEKAAQLPSGVRRVRAGFKALPSSYLRP